MAHHKICNFYLTFQSVASKGFWRWCAILGITVFFTSPSSGILKNTNEHDVSETRLFPSSGDRAGDTYSAGLTTVNTTNS